jgi:hypothetical protein
MGQGGLGSATVATENKLVTVRGTKRVVGPIDSSRMEQMCRDDLTKAIARLFKIGLNVEEVKQWLVHQIPNSLTVVANRGALRRRASRRHTVPTAQGKRNKSAVE